MGGGGGRGCRAAWPFVLLSAASVGCGAGPSAIPSASEPGLRTLQLVSGDDGVAVPGAPVRVGSRTTVADSQGRITIDLWDGESLDVAAVGFLHRETTLGQAAQVSLWPVGPAYPEEYVRHLLYTAAGRAVARDQPLRRVVAGAISVVLSEELARDARAAGVHRHAAALATEASGGAVRFQVDPAARGEVVFLSSLDTAGGHDGALTYRSLRGDTIVGGRITFSDLRYARDLRFVTHELGHALGLQHSPHPDDMMHFSCGAGCAESFSDRERLTIRLLLQRRPGNTYPDRDRGLALASLPGQSIIVD